MNKKVDIELSGRGAFLYAHSQNTSYVGSKKTEGQTYFAGEGSRDLSMPVDPRQHAVGIEVLSRLMRIREP